MASRRGSPKASVRIGGATRNGVRSMPGSGPKGAPKAVNRRVGATRNARAVASKAPRGMGGASINGAPSGNYSPSAGAMTGGSSYGSGGGA